MEKIYYKHKETGRLINLDNLKRYKGDELCYAVGFLGDLDIREIDGRRKHLYTIQDVPFSEDFEVIVKPLFTEIECHEMYRLISSSNVFPHTSPSVSTSVLMKLVGEMKRHEEHRMRYGGNLDEI